MDLSNTELKITSAEFITAAVSPKQFPKDNFPQIAFAGRSNVGKSSLINSLLNRKNLAKTSSTPGKTRQIIFFKINEKFYFVDLPGYGYAKVAKSEQNAWKERIETYFNHTKTLKLLLLLIDIRRGLTPLDIQMIDFLKFTGIPFLLVLTKSDKLSKNECAKITNEVYKMLNLTEQNKPILFSSLSKAGREELWTAILSYVNF